MSTFANAPAQRPPVTQTLWPYVWALRSRNHLDWANGMDEAAQCEEVKRMAKLPVDIADNLYLGDAVCAGDVARLASRAASTPRRAGMPIGRPRRAAGNDPRPFRRRAAGTSSGRLSTHKGARPRA